MELVKDTKTRKKQVELSAIHDFAGKLKQPAILKRLKEYVRWQVNWRQHKATGLTIDEVAEIPYTAPVSINLDLTTSCNYRCDHCVDFDILNSKIRFDHDKLKTSLTDLHRRGLRSVIVIGGGEPTVYPFFQDALEHMKDLGLKVGIVTNGSFMNKIEDIAHRLDEQDWVRLSLDSGSDDLFQKMHKPRRKITLDDICAGVAPVKAKNGAFKVGFSYIIVWQDCEANDAAIHENVHEIVMAAKRARKYGFDYISFKPFLTRAEGNNAEIIELVREKQHLHEVIATIREQIDIAKTYATDSFQVYESTNLKVLENGSWQDYTHQPKTCHMTFFRQVLSPLGLFNCPVYRHVPHARLGHKHHFSDEELFNEAQRNTLKNIDSFDASKECKEVTCLYNHVNWYIEDLIAHPEKLDAIEAAPDREDYFL